METILINIFLKFALYLLRSILDKVELTVFENTFVFVMCFWQCLCSNWKSHYNINKVSRMCLSVKGKLSKHTGEDKRGE